jgi:DNA-directed RNA polymerase subunit M/transcription elongation factor TFIIS
MGVINKPKGKRGRPKKRRYGTEEESYIVTKHSKFYGYCTVCKLALCSKDIRHTVFICPGCGYSGKLKELKLDRDTERPRNRREYLQSVYADWSLAKELRVKEEDKTLHHDIPSKTEEEKIIEEELPEEPEI